MDWKHSASSKAASRLGQNALCAAIIGAALGLSADATAAELRGRIRAHGADRAPAGAGLYAACGGTEKNVVLAGAGSYSIRGLPSGKACEVWVEISGKESRRIPFATSGPVTRFSGQVRRRGSRVILMPD